ncbi:MAG: hypothetical protein GKC05_03140 [Methanomicrobiales archaeon]|nr:hypothetical protein [Methanomicrobiales archaeon]
MNREHVLAIILALSLCANIYLVFTDNSSLDHDINGIVHRALLYPEPVASDNSSPDLSPDTVPEDDIPDTAVETPVITPEPTVPTPTPTTDGWTKYSSQKYAFSFRYPVTWELNDGATGSPSRMVVLTAPPETECDPISAQCYKYIATMTFDIDRDPQTLNLEEYFNSAVASLQREYAITSTSRSASCMLSGNRAYQIEFYTRDDRGNPDRSYMQYYTLIDKKGYIISYTGPFSNWENVFSINKGDAQRIIDSFVVERNYEIV